MTLFGNRVSADVMVKTETQRGHVEAETGLRPAMLVTSRSWGQGLEGSSPGACRESVALRHTGAQAPRLQENRLLWVQAAQTVGLHYCNPRELTRSRRQRNVARLCH